MSRQELPRPIVIHLATQIVRAAFAATHDPIDVIQRDVADWFDRRLDRNPPASHVDVAELLQAVWSLGPERRLASGSASMSRSSRNFT